MREKLLIASLLVGCLLMALVPGAAAQTFNNIDQNVVIKEVVQGHTIFFGEEHVDVTDCVTYDGVTFPYVVTLNVVRNVTDALRIENPADFTLPTDKPENDWYLSPDGVVPFYAPDGSVVKAFISQESVFSFDVWNADTDMKADAVTYRGNVYRFKYNVETNLDDIATRKDYPDVGYYINMTVVAPDGEQFLQLMSLDTVTGVTSFRSLTGLDVNPSAGWIWPENTQPGGAVGWWTGWRDATPNEETNYRYKLGEYSVVGLCNVNNMFKNHQAPQSTWMEKKFTLAARPLSITSTGVSGRDKSFTATVTGLPNTVYQIFIYDECPTKLTGKICDRPPFISGDREQLAKTGIALDPIEGAYATGSRLVVDCCTQNTTIRQLVPSGDAFPSTGTWDILEKGTRYYASVTTGPDGTVTVPFWVDTTVNEGSYTIQVQDIEYQQKADVIVPITKGAITASLKDITGTAKSSFFVGDEIWIEGSNSDSNMTYVWLTGPGLDPCGVNLLDPSVSDPLKVVVYDTRNGQSNYWRIDPNWMTNNTPIGPGEYTLWFASVNADGRFCTCNGESGTCNLGGCLGIACERGVCELQNCPECGVFISVPITLVKPDLSAEINDVNRCCCPGYPCGLLGGTEEIIVNGSSGGNSCKNLQMWLFGQSQFGTKNYLTATTPLYCDDTYSFELNKGLFQPNGIDLCNLAPGTYDLIVQAPGNNGMFNVRLGEPEVNGDRFVLTTMPTQDSRVFMIEGKDALYGRVALKSLTDGLNQQGIDDVYVHVQFNLSEKKCEGNVDFSADRTEGNAPLTVQFTDKSVMEGVSWTWSSNGAAFSTEQNPKYTFTTPGKYTIRMEVTDAEGVTNAAVKESYINVLSSPVADFSFGPQPAGINEQVHFTDQSTGAPTSWMWDFGDKNTSSLQSPAHAYAEAGTYEVTLTVSNAMGIGIPVKKSITIVHDKPAADFVGSPTESSFYPATVSFTDLSTGVVTAWNWEFSTEGKQVATSADKNPVITFNNPGIYDVTLTITNNGGKSTASKPGYITVGTGSLINLAPGYNHVAIPRMVTADYDTVAKLFAGVDTAGVPFAIYGADDGMTNWTNVSNDYKVRPLEAIRVYSTGTVSIRPTYIEEGAYSKSLSPGWEGIGIMAMQPTPANVALASLGESWDKVLAFNPKTQRWEYPIIRGVDDDKTMDPTVGYLIQMNAAGILIGGDA
jgi:PKD repeat protein